MNGRQRIKINKQRAWVDHDGAEALYVPIDGAWRYPHLDRKATLGTEIDHAAARRTHASHEERLPQPAQRADTWTGRFGGTGLAARPLSDEVLRRRQLQERVSPWRICHDDDPRLRQPAGDSTLFDLIEIRGSGFGCESSARGDLSCAVGRGFDATMVRPALWPAVSSQSQGEWALADGATPEPPTREPAQRPDGTLCTSAAARRSLDTDRQHPSALREACNQVQHTVVAPWQR